MPDAKPLRADARRNRDALLSKARELFAAGEFFDLRFDDFAGLAGVGTGTLYRHFPTREALAEAVYHEEVVTLCTRAREAQATLPAADALAAFLRGMIDYLDAHHGLARTPTTASPVRSPLSWPPERTRSPKAAGPWRRRSPTWSPPQLLPARFATTSVRALS